MIRTLRARLTAWYLLSLGLSLTFFSVLLYMALSRILSSHHDEELSQQAVSLGEVLASGKNARLYRRLVYSERVAVDVSAHQNSRELGSSTH